MLAIHAEKKQNPSTVHVMCVEHTFQREDATCNATYIEEYIFMELLITHLH